MDAMRGGAAPLALVGAAHALRAASLYAASDALVSGPPICLFLLVTLALAAVCSSVLHRPGLAPPKATLRRSVVCHGLVLACALWLWCYGLKHCGPVRAVLIETAALLATCALDRRRPAASRGALLLLLLAAGTLLGTHGAHPYRHLRAAHRVTSNAAAAAAAAAAREASARLLPPHVLGEVALVAGAGLVAAQRRASRRLARALGGSRRLFALSVATAAAAMVPGAAWAWHVAAPHAPQRAPGPLGGLAWADGLGWGWGWGWLGRAALFTLFGLLGAQLADAAATSSEPERAARAAGSCAFLAAAAVDHVRAYSLASSGSSTFCSLTTP